MNDKALALNSQIEGVNVNKRYQFTENCYFICTAVTIEFINNLDLSYGIKSNGFIAGEFELINGMADEDERGIAIREMQKSMQEHKRFKELEMKIDRGRCELRVEFFI